MALMFDVQVPFFIPLWRRVVVTLVCWIWGGFEFSTGAAIWGVLFCGIGAYCIWQFFLDGWPEKKEPD